MPFLHEKMGHRFIVKGADGNKVPRGQEFLGKRVILEKGKGADMIQNPNDLRSSLPSLAKACWRLMLLVCLMVSLSTPSWAKIYHVDGNKGNDGYS
ncbi:MAG: hypothetical protein QG577_1974, partial [Thermodesulfobacteriota bacterium]|nr:hypothetical protein [Thermodesulfobacteriota bacterium]